MSPFMRKIWSDLVRMDEVAMKVTDRGFFRLLALGGVYYSYYQAMRPVSAGMDWSLAELRNHVTWDVKEMIEGVKKKLDTDKEEMTQMFEAMKKEMLDANKEEMTHKFEAMKKEKLDADKEEMTHKFEAMKKEMLDAHKEEMTNKFEAMKKEMLEELNKQRKWW